LAYHQSRSNLNGWIAEIPVRDRVTNSVQWFLAGPYSLSHRWWIFAGICAVGIATVTLLCTARERRGAMVSLAIGSASILVPLLATAVGQDFWLFRNLIAAWIPLALALACGLATRHRVGIVVRAGLVVVTAVILTFSTVAAIAVTSGHSETRSNWRGLARCLGRARPTRVLLVSPAYQQTVLRLYRRNVRPVPDGAGAVSELDVIGGLPARVGIPAGFERSGRACSQSITIDRFRSAARRSVPPPTGDAVLLSDQPTAR
jgi:hypothetical protein